MSALLPNWSDEELERFITSGGRQAPGMGEIAADVGKSAMTGLVNAGASIAGLPGDIQSLAGMGARAIAPPAMAEMQQAVGQASPRFPTSDAVRGKIEEWTGPSHQPTTTPGKLARSLVEMAPVAALPAGGPIQRMVNVAGPAVGAEIGDLASGGSAAGRAGGALVGGLVAGRGFTPAPATAERMALVRALENEGVPLTAGQRSGSKPLQWFEQAAADTPISGGVAARINEAQGRAFTGAALRRMGASGDELATPGVVNRETARIGQAFDDLSARNTLRADPEMAADLGTVRQTYLDSVIPSQRAQGRQNIDAILGDIVNTVQQNGGQIPGALYQTTRSRLSAMADGARQNDNQLADAIGGIRNALDDVMGRSIAPADQAAWQQARREWANWKVLEKAITGAGSQTAEGFISPSQLRAAVAGQNRGAYARGQGDLAELARAGEATMRPLPNSGTAARAAAAGAYGMAGGLAGNQAGGGDSTYTILGAALPMVMGRAMLSRPVQAYLGNQAAPMSRAQLRNALLAEQLLARPRTGGE